MKIVYKRSFQKDFDSLFVEIRERVDKAILKLAKDPFSGDVKKLKGISLYRARVGQYRILFSLDSSNGLLILEAVKHRREAYR